MYRDPTASLVETINRLESELRELRAVRARPLVRAHVLVAVAVVSVLGAIGTLMTLTASLGRIHELERLYMQSRWEAEDTEGARNRCTSKLDECESSRSMDD